MEIKDLVISTAQKVDQIHAVIFGVENQGGLHRRIEQLEKQLTKLEMFRASTLGLSSVGSIILTILVDYLLHQTK